MIVAVAVAVAVGVAVAVAVTVAAAVVVVAAVEAGAGIASKAPVAVAISSGGVGGASAVVVVVVVELSESLPTAPSPDARFSIIAKVTSSQPFLFDRKRRGEGGTSNRAITMDPNRPMDRQQVSRVRSNDDNIWLCLTGFERKKGFVFWGGKV